MTHIADISKMATPTYWRAEIAARREELEDHRRSLETELEQRKAHAVSAHATGAAAERARYDQSFEIELQLRRRIEQIELVISDHEAQLTKVEERTQAEAERLRLQQLDQTRAEEFARAGRMDSLLAELAREFDALDRGAALIRSLGGHCPRRTNQLMLMAIKLHLGQERLPTFLTANPGKRLDAHFAVAEAAVSSDLAKVG